MRGVFLCLNPMGVNKKSPVKLYVNRRFYWNLLFVIS